MSVCDDELTCWWSCTTHTATYLSSPSCLYLDDPWRLDELALRYVETFIFSENVFQVIRLWHNEGRRSCRWWRWRDPAHCTLVKRLWNAFQSWSGQRLRPPVIPGRAIFVQWRVSRSSSTDDISTVDFHCLSSGKTPDHPKFGVTAIRIDLIDSIHKFLDVIVLTGQNLYLKSFLL